MSDQQMNDAPLPQDDGHVPPAQVVQAAPLPGGVLADQRQKKGWTIEQVASLVKLAPRQIQAIEADNYGALPGLAVARGFVRSYAKALGLDANAVVAGMPQDSPVAQRDHIVPQHSLSTPFSESPLPAMMMSNRGGNSSALFIAAGVLAVAVVAGAAAVRWTALGDDVPQLAWLKSHKAEPTSSDAAPATDAAVAADGASTTETLVNARVDTIDSSAKPADVPAEPAMPAPASAPAPMAMAMQAATPSAAAPTPVVSAPVAAPAAAPAVPAAPVTPAAAPASAATLAPGLNIVNSKDMLRLTFREDSWVEIRRADKTTIISRLLKAGTSEAFDVSDASVLVVGNAAGVDATLRGQPLELKSAGGNNVARLNLN